MLGNGYSYQMYLNGGGTGSMTVYGVGAQFSAKWNGVGDFLGRVGLGFNETQTYTEIGTITANFAFTSTGTGGAFSYIGIYGWSVNPLHEYYIVDNWLGATPVPGTKVGTITVDGGTYNVFTHTQTNQPAITGGNATFVQFFSVRQTARTCGTITISEHFAQWATLGMQLGNLEEARILVEVGGGGNGTIDFTTATVQVN
jgi:endo-1,4-beta-xylanase